MTGHTVYSLSLHVCKWLFLFVRPLIAFEEVYTITLTLYHHSLFIDPTQIFQFELNLAHMSIFNMGNYDYMPRTANRRLNYVEVLLLVLYPVSLCADQTRVKRDKNTKLLTCRKAVIMWPIGQTFCRLLLRCNVS